MYMVLLVGQIGLEGEGLSANSIADYHVTESLGDNRYRIFSYYLGCRASTLERKVKSQKETP